MPRIIPTENTNKTNEIGPDLAPVKKSKTWLWVLVGVTVTLVVIATTVFIWQKSTGKKINEQSFYLQQRFNFLEDNRLKYYCATGIDCTLSNRDPDGFATCVNKNWNNKWNQNPESKNYVWKCESTGQEQCECMDNECQRADSEPGC